jgi:hypothetical protein
VIEISGEVEDLLGGLGAIHTEDQQLRHLDLPRGGDAPQNSTKTPERIEGRETSIAVQQDKQNRSSGIADGVSEAIRLFCSLSLAGSLLGRRLNPCKPP